MKALLILFFPMIASAGLPPAPSYEWFSSKLTPRSDCAEVREMQSALDRYASDLRVGAPLAKIAAQAKMLKSTAARIALGSGACREAALSHYLLKSAYLLTKDAGDRTSISDRRGPFSMGWTFGTLLALNEGFVEFTEGTREVLHGQDGRSHSVLASYQCTRRKVRVNPAQAPFDLAAIFVHELVHTISDRWSGNEFTGMEASDFTKRLLFEEGAAALLAGHLQRQFLSKSVAPALRGKDWGDLNLFSREGVLTRASRKQLETVDWNAAEAEKEADISDYEATNASIVGGISREELLRHRSAREMYSGYWLTQTFLCGRSESISNLKRGEVNDYMKRLLDQIARPYFGRRVSMTEVMSLQDEQTNKNYAKVYPDCAYPLMPRNYLKLLDYWTFVPEETIERIITTKFPLLTLDVGYGYPLPYFPHHFDTLTEKAQRRSIFLNGPATSCVRFVELARDGKLAGYLGQSRPDTKPGTDGSRPGTDGSRPGTDGSRPGTDGSRPAIDDPRSPRSRPSRLNTEGLKPCVQLGDKL